MDYLFYEASLHLFLSRKRMQEGRLLPVFISGVRAPRFVFNETREAEVPLLHFGFQHSRFAPPRGAYLCINF